MAIKVTAPNGAMVQFPDGTDRDTIHGVMMQHFGNAPADPVTANDVGRSFASGVPIIGGLLDKADAATNAALAPVLNPLFDPKDQLSEPTFGERYAHSLRDQQGADAKFAEQHPVIDKAAQLAGGVATMVPAAAAAPGLMGVTGSLGSRTVAGGLSNAAIGGADAAARGENPVTGAIVGGLTGAVLPGATDAIAHVALNNPIVSNISARLDPAGFARRQVARGISESGQTPQQIGRSVTDAAAEGQSEFNVADETGARLTAARGAAADAEYGAVRTDANPVDLVGTINHMDGIIGTQPGQVITPANDSIEAILTPFRQRLARVNPDDFAAVQRIRGDMADAAQNAMQSGYGNRARLIRGAVGQLDTAMENASAGHLAANRNFAQASRNIEAVDAGRTAATRGRTEDTLPAFQALQPEGQAAFRSGYVDPLIAKVQGDPFGANKAGGMLHSDAFRTEAGAMAPGNPLMQARLARERTMFETRQTALGGSKTADNLNDHAAMAIDPHLVGAVGHVLSGNIGGAVRSVGHLVANGWTGNTPQVRAEVARILLQRAPGMQPAALENMVSQTIARLRTVQDITRRISRSVSGAAVPQENRQ